MRGGVVALALALAACHDESRRFEDLAATSDPTARPAPPRLTENAYTVAQGQQLYAWMNCVGCHGNGGGGIGPPLMDDQWRYGSSPEAIHETIMKGRPNGMPSYEGKLPDSEVWKIVAYVRTLAGLGDAEAASARKDEMHLAPEQNLNQKREPR